ncbi:hypothetical protein EST38_g8609 [Candolleomyces aberdarensis]|uniref:Uncharacterized protein n=1 Tax=Candolleomyces aberdarensis TaxID=2316362 RepID=A0A4Q2DED0_9AGAR|nr:hypothetical protein EST38_g8609 [Candolleomyces aberdarensis]
MLNSQRVSPAESLITAPWQPGCGISFFSPSATDIGSEQDGEKRLQVQMKRNAELYVKFAKRKSWFMDEDLWALCKRKALRRWRTIGRAIFCLDSEDEA